MSDSLTLSSNLENPDGFYDALTQAHDGKSKAESDALNARLIFLLANHIGAESVLQQALEAASTSAHT